MRRTVWLSTAVVLALVAACMTALVVAVVKPAEATFPGQNGKIAFASTRSGDWDIYAMNPDGSRVQLLTVDPPPPPMTDGGPAWSADGTKITFHSTTDAFERDIYSMNADGSNRTQLTNSSDWEADPTWSPDGSRIAYVRSLPAGEGAVRDQIYLMDADGSDQVPLLADDSSSQYHPTWSPDGSKIAFVRSGAGTHIYTVNVDGTGLTRLTGGASSPPGDFYNREDPNWSPDGSKILFARYGPCSSVSCTPEDSQYEVFVMNADGSGRKKRLTNNLVHDKNPIWSPDGTRIVFTSERDGDQDIWRMRPDGSNKTKLTFNTVVDQEPDWQARP
jgi:Tol biopolymer transport system component